MSGTIKKISVALSVMIALGMGSFVSPALAADKNVTAAKTEDENSSVSAHVDKAVSTIGEKIKYSVEVTAPEGSAIEFPVITVELGGFAVKDFGEEKLKKAGKGRVKYERWYLLDTYTVGPYVIPAQPVRIKMKDGGVSVLTAPKIFVEIKSVMKPGEKDARIKDIKLPLGVPAKYAWVLIAGFAALILSAGAALWIYTHRKKAAETIEIKITAHEAAFKELDRIKRLGLVEDGKIKEYYYLVSICLRKYIEDRFSIKAPEQTTEEFIETAMRSDKLEGKYINLLKDYLERSDLVKYAKLEPETAECGKVLETARQFIDETKVIIQEEPEEE
ncbi:MAG: hypothetical protein HQL28_06130 [Candidatus Omnitrophica bacterium]|nr:hypothetical protein [Candidatus Omnitrophota bacterium]